MVLDTMIFAYAAFRTPPFWEEAYAVLMKASDVSVPESFFAEFVNVAWLNVRRGALSASAAEAALIDVRHYVANHVPIDDLWLDALRLSVSANHSPYDTLFVALAEREATRLVTYDAKLLTAFPNVALSPAEYLRKS